MIQRDGSILQPPGVRATSCRPTAVMPVFQAPLRLVANTAASSVLKRTTAEGPPGDLWNSAMLAMPVRHTYVCSFAWDTNQYLCGICHHVNFKVMP